MGAAEASGPCGQARAGLDRRADPARRSGAQQYGLVAALPWFEQALKRDPRTAATLIRICGDAQGDIGLHRRRARRTRAAPRRPRPRASLQALYLPPSPVIAARAGNFDLARAILERTGGAIDDLPGMIHARRRARSSNGDYEQAIEQLTDFAVGTHGR